MTDKKKAEKEVEEAVNKLKELKKPETTPEKHPAEKTTTQKNSTENKKGKFLELKSKPINFRQNKNGLGQTIQKLPASIDDVEISYMKQVAFYWKATGKKAYLGYVNSEEYKIFEPEDDRLEYYYKQLINKAFTIQNLLEISEGDPKVMAKYVEMPDVKNFYYSDLTEEQVDITKQLWGI